MSYKVVQIVKKMFYFIEPIIENINQNTTTCQVFMTAVSPTQFNLMA